MRKIVIRELAQLQQRSSPCGPRHVTFDHGALALDAISHATAEDLLIALRGQLQPADAKTLVRILLDAGLTFDKTIDDEA